MGLRGFRPVEDIISTLRTAQRGEEIEEEVEMKNRRDLYFERARAYFILLWMEEWPC